jgi:GNAT superfamily N-acetyltransferase
MRLRRARAADVSLLPAVELSSGRLFEGVTLESTADPEETLPMAALNEALESNSLWVTVDSRDQPNGFVAAVVRGDESFIAQLSVALEAQGQGLGRELMQTVIADARNRGLTAVTLTTFREVPWNAPFYAKLGFRLLDPDELSPHLVATLANEASRGLLPAERCAMRLIL